jgi:hypothetical protein
MNITSISRQNHLVATESTLFTASAALNFYSAQQLRVANCVNLTFPVAQKSPAFVLGEQIVRPLIDKGVHLGGRLFSLAKKGIATADRIFSKMVPSLPGVAADPSVQVPSSNSGLKASKTTSTLEQQAVVRTFFKFVQSQIDDGADVNGVYSKEEGTFLQAASAIGCLDAIKLLISRKADVNQRAEYNSLAYQLEGIWKLASGSVRNENDQTPLLLAAKNRQPAAVKVLLDAGALLNLVDKNGETALFFGG